MFLILFIFFFLVWMAGWIMFRAAGTLIHFLLIVAFISLIVHFVRSELRGVAILMTSPIWLDEYGQRRPTRQCSISADVTLRIPFW